MNCKVEYDIRSWKPTAKVNGLPYLPDAIITTAMVPAGYAVGGYASPMLVLLTDKQSPISQRVFSCDLTTRLGEDDTLPDMIRRFVYEITGDETINVPEEFIHDVIVWKDAM